MLRKQKKEPVIQEEQELEYLQDDKEKHGSAQDDFFEQQEVQRIVATIKKLSPALRDTFYLYCVSNPINAVIAIVGAIASIVALVKKGSSKHGVSVKIKKTQRKVRKNGHTYTLWNYSITGMGIY